ncbi:MAG: GvpL/GvpF family gas vesicle protein [Gemmatimonadota bacterium]
MTEQPKSLIYLYAIVPSGAPDAPPELRGLEDEPVELLRVGDVAAVIGQVPGEAYSDDALNERLDDLAWVGERGMAHERVLDWYAERDSVIPLSLFSIHRDRERVERRVAEDRAEFLRILGALRGRKEWGIKLWRVESEAREGVDELSPSLQELQRQIEAAPAGRRFLLEKKREEMRTEEVRTSSKRIAHELFAALGRSADRSASVPVPAGAAGGDRLLLLNAAYLVPDEGFERFQQGVTEQAGRLAGSGFQIEFTGPWPPYHFSEPEDD